jgi:DNA replication protein DnaC
VIWPASTFSADAYLIENLSNLEFTDTAQNAVFMGWLVTGKTHLTTALAVPGTRRRIRNSLK